MKTTERVLKADPVSKSRGRVLTKAQALVLVLVSLLMSSFHGVATTEDCVQTQAIKSATRFLVILLRPVRTRLWYRSNAMQTMLRNEATLNKLSKKTESIQNT